MLKKRLKNILESKKTRLEWSELTLIWRAAAASAASGPQWSRAATFGQKICGLSLVLSQYSDVLEENNLVQLGQKGKNILLEAVSMKM